jgi:hypothetical protein
MKRVFTDDRYPGVQIVNEGGREFEVWVGAKIQTTFESWENPDGTVSEAFAARRAHDYFERAGRVDVSRQLEESLDLPPDRDHTDVFSAPVQKPSASEIDALMSKERLETDPAKRAELRQHILNLMRQEETLAEGVVSHLLEM